MGERGIAHVQHKGLTNSMQAKCGAKTRSGEPCKNAQMLNGRCRMHGGATKNAGRPSITGRYSLAHRKSLADKAQVFLNDQTPADLSGELALMRALLQEYLDRYGDGVSLPADEIERIFGMVETISRLVERITKILASTALTAAEVQYLQARIADLLMKYVPDDRKRNQFILELQGSIGGGGRDSGPVFASSQWETESI